MQLRQIDDNYSVTSQIEPDDVRDLAAEGFQSIICNRPDGEGGAEQTNFEDIARVAEKAGLKAYYIPVAGGVFTQADIDATIAAIKETDGAIVAYCRSGARSEHLYGLARSQTNK